MIEAVHDYITARELVDELGITGHSARRWAYRQIKNILLGLYGSKSNELFFTNSRDKKYVAKIPLKDVKYVKETLLKMRVVKKKEIIYDEKGNEIEQVVTYKRW